MAEFNVQTRHYGSCCFSLFLSSQVQSLLFFFTESTMSIFLNDLVIINQLIQLELPSDSCCQSSLDNKSVNEFVSMIPLS